MMQHPAVYILLSIVFNLVTVEEFTLKSVINVFIEQGVVFYVLFKGLLVYYALSTCSKLLVQRIGSLVEYVAEINVLYLVIDFIVLLYSKKVRGIVIFRYNSGI